MPQGRYGAVVEVFKRNEQTGLDELVHTGFKTLPPCAGCGSRLHGVIAKRPDGALVCESCATPGVA